MTSPCGGENSRGARDEDYTRDGFVKVRFLLEPDEDGWPPCDVEDIWGEEIGPGLVRLDNSPFFAYGVSYNDIVAIRRSIDGLEFDIERYAGEMVVWVAQEAQPRLQRLSR